MISLNPAFSLYVGPADWSLKILVGGNEFIHERRVKALVIFSPQPWIMAGVTCSPMRGNLLIQRTCKLPQKVRIVDDHKGT